MVASITSRSRSPSTKKMTLKKLEAEERSNSIAGSTTQTIKTNGSGVTSEHLRLISQRDEPLPSSENRLPITDAGPLLHSEDVAVSQVGLTSSTSDLNLSRWSVRRSKLPPPLESSRSMPLIKRFKSILAPKRAPTAPLPTKEFLPSTDLRGLSLDDSPTNQPSSEPEIEHLQNFDFALPDQPSLENKVKTGDVTELSDEPTTSISHLPYCTADTDTAAPSKTSTASGFDAMVSTISGDQQTPEAGGQIAEDLGLEEGILTEVENEARYSDDDIRDLEALVMPSSDAGAVRDLQATIRNSVDSVSSYTSTLSSLSVSSRSSMEIDGEIATTTTSQLDPLDDEVDAGPSPTILQPPRIMELLPDSPTDPLFQQGRLSPIPPSIHRRTPSASPKASPRSSTTPELPQGQQQMLKLPPTDGTGKRTCRGCSDAILLGQKSVTSADGRLTGRYHKQCFVCTTCQSGFATAEFYVFNDHPYCDQHYHELNDTICTGCGKGIEGQLMETSPRLSDLDKAGGQKYHLKCFTCTTCHTILKEDYFELNGRVYCEKDAFRLANFSTKAAHDTTPTRSSPLIRELVAGSLEPVVRDPADEATVAPEASQAGAVDPELVLALETEPFDGTRSTDEDRTRGQLGQ